MAGLLARRRELSFAVAIILAALGLGAGLTDVAGSVGAGETRAGTPVPGYLMAPQATAQGRIIVFSYDAAGRLTGATYGDRSVTYAYDSAGNPLTRQVSAPAATATPTATSTPTPGSSRLFLPVIVSDFASSW
ncbi:MAG: RHS repeat protein [Chloroflexi bacterium]|nr:RHS repeat protein [Chloroflexota bacterium]